MEHSKRYEKVAEYYKKGLWKEPRVHEAVVKGWIQPWEYEELIGKPYEE